MMNNPGGRGRGERNIKLRHSIGKDNQWHVRGRGLNSAAAAAAAAA